MIFYIFTAAIHNPIKKTLTFLKAVCPYALAAILLSCSNGAEKKAATEKKTRDSLLSCEQNLPKRYAGTADTSGIQGRKVSHEGMVFIPAGEFLMGYKNEYKVYPDTPVISDPQGNMNVNV
ncbi:MAG: hypothetical protein EOP48_29150, partial [Sphingobacteriales bacterium]